MDISEWINKRDKEFVSVLKFVNDLFKRFKVSFPLRQLLEYVLENFELDNIMLYAKTGATYEVVGRTNVFENETFTEVLNNIYLELDDTQIGINFSEEGLAPFKKYYVRADDVADLAPDSKPVQTQKPLGEYQRLLITYSTFTHQQITCLLTDYNPAYSHNDDSFNAYYDMVENAIKAGKLTHDDEFQIPATQVKLWLSDHGYIFEGFNDNLQTKKTNGNSQLASQPDNQLQAENKHLKRRIAELEQQLREAQSSLSKANNIDLNIKNEQVINSLKDDLEKLTTENNTLKQQISKQVTMPADDKELSPKSEAKVVDLVYTLLSMANLEHELTVGGKGNTNLLIETTSKKLKNPLSNNFIATWLKKAYQLHIKDLEK